MHAHRLKCPKCGASRYVDDPKDGAKRAAKCFYFFPLAPYVRSLYSRPDLVPHLYADRYDPNEPEGGVRRSRGWKMKMQDNPQMAQDHRNLGLVGTTDGVPFFRDQRRGGWPYILRYISIYAANILYLRYIPQSTNFYRFKGAPTCRMDSPRRWQTVTFTS